MEMTGLNLNTFSGCPMVLPTQQVVKLNEVPELPHVWLPDLEDYLCPENDYKINKVLVQKSAEKGRIYTENSVKIITTANVQDYGQHYTAKNDLNTNNLSVQNSEDILYDQIVQLEEFDGEVIQTYFNTSEQSDSFDNGITMEVIDSGKQITLTETGNMEGKLKEISTMGSTSKSQGTNSKSPKTSRKSTDYRRRREKANEREKQRIVVLKNAMNVLKNAIPAARGKTKITKLEVLKLARDYINSLKNQLIEEPGLGEIDGCHFE